MQFKTGHFEVQEIISIIPENISFFDDEIDQYNQGNASSVKLKKAMGYSQHSICSSDATISDFVSKAKIKELFGDNLSQVDALIVCTQTPDFMIPNTASVLHGLLGLKEEVGTFDVSDGCVGYLRGIALASFLLKDESISKVLLVCGDVLSRWVNRGDRNSFPLIGDAVTLTVLAKTKNSDDDDVNYYGEIYHSGDSCLAISIPSSGSRHKISNSSLISSVDSEGNMRSPSDLYMKGRDVFNFTQMVVAPFIKNFLTKLKRVECEKVYCHQANLFILKKMRSKLGLSKLELPSYTIENYGNSSSASIPTEIVLNCSDPNNIVNKSAFLCGFGAGLSWGASRIKFSQNFSSNLIEVNV